MTLDEFSDVRSQLHGAADLRWLRGLATNLLRGDASLADDVTQQAFVAALKTPPDEPSRFAAWLSRTTKNFALRARRDEARRSTRERAAAREEAIPSVEDIVGIEESRRRIVDAVVALDPPLRRIVLLHYWSGMTSVSIAARDGIPDSTVRNRLRRAHEQLRRTLESEFGDDETWRRFVSMILVRGAGSAAPSPLGVRSMSAKATTILVTSVVVLGISILVLFPRDPRDEPPTALVARPGPIVEAPRPDPVVASVTVAPPSERSAVAATALAAGTTGVDASKNLVLRVVNAETKLPVKGARVLVAKNALDAVAAFHSSRGAGFFEEWDPEGNITRIPGSTTKVTDANGEVEIPSDGSSYSTCARLGTLFGRAAISTRETREVAVLELHPDPDLRVRVEHRDGTAAANVSVALLTTKPRPMPIAGELVAMKHATTDSNGIAIFHDLAASFRLRRTLGSIYAVGLGAPYSADLSPRVAIDPNALPTDPIRLVLPPSAQIDFVCVDESGSPPESTEHLALGVMLSPVADSILPGSNELLWIPVSPAGHARLEVGLGITMGGEVLSLTEHREPCRFEFEGPVAEGEIMTQRIVLPRVRPRVLGVLVDESAKPVAGQVLSASFEPPYPYDLDASLIRVLTGPDGRFEIPVRSLARTANPSRIVLEPTTFGSAPNGTATIPIDAASVAQRDHDAGEIVLHSLPIVARGRVLDVKGNGIGGAEIEYGTASSKEGRREHGPRSDADGSFEIRDANVHGPVRIRASKPSYVQEQEVIAKDGATIVEIRLVSSGALEGSVESADGIELSSLLLIVEPSGKEGPASFNSIREAELRPLGKDGRFHIDSLPAGRMRLTISVRDQSAMLPLLRIDDLTIALGETNRDPRVQSISLARTTRLVEFEVFDSANRPVDHAFVRVREAGRTSGPSRTASTDAAGRARLRLPKEPQDVIVTKPGLRTAILERVEGNRRVVLEAAQRVQVQVLGIPKAQVDYSVFVQPESASNTDVEELERWMERGRSAGAALDAEGHATVYLTEPGKYVVFVSRNASNGTGTLCATRPLDLSSGVATTALTIDLEKPDAK